MPFSMNVKNLFSGPEPSVSEKSTEGGAQRIGQLFGSRPDPTTAFIDALLGRVKADREANYANELFGQVGIEAPKSNALADLFLGRQGPNLESLKTYGSLQKNLSDMTDATSKGPLNQAQAGYYTALSNYLGGQASGGATVDPTVLNPEFTSSDYVNTPTIKSVRGVPVQTSLPTLKPAPDDAAAKKIGAIRSTFNNLNNNLKLMTPAVKAQMSPLNPLAARGSLTNAALSVQALLDPKSGAKDFLTFKAETDKTFQEFRKDTTGAQAALKELGWLAPDYPLPSDPPEVYIAKTLESQKRLAQGEQILIALEAQKGNRISQLSKGSLDTNKGGTFNSTEEADASGLPAGTVVLVGGRRYQIG